MGLNILEEVLCRELEEVRGQEGHYAATLLRNPLIFLPGRKSVFQN